MFKQCASILAVAGFLAFAMPARAATITVPGDHLTLTAAIDAATTGDTILITNTADYAESLLINKPLTIKAAPDAGPRILGSGATGHVVRFDPGSQGSVFGDYDGGMIKLNGDSFDNTTLNMTVVKIAATTGTITLERVKLEGHYDYHTGDTGMPAGIKRRAANKMFEIGTSTAIQSCNVILNYVEVTGGSYAVHCLGASNVCDLKISNSIFLTKIFGLYPRQGHKLDVRDTIVTTSNGSWAPLYWESSGNQDHVLANCWFKSIPSAFTDVSRRAHSTSFSNCVFTVTAGNAGAVTYSGNSFAGETGNFDHCDFYTSSTAPVFNFAKATSPNDGNRTLRITNSNLVNRRGSQLIGWTSATVPGFYKDRELIVRNNNMFTSVPLTLAEMVRPNPVDGFTTYSVEEPVARILPDYADPINGNFHYNNATLATLGDGGTALGARRDFTTLRLGAVPVELSSFGLN